MLEIMNTTANVKILIKNWSYKIITQIKTMKIVHNLFESLPSQNKVPY